MWSSLLRSVQDPSWWKLWLTRIAVAVAIGFTLEYLQRRPNVAGSATTTAAVSTTATPPEQQARAAMKRQYRRNDGTTTSDVNGASTESDSKNDDIHTTSASGRSATSRQNNDNDDLLVTQTNEKQPKLDEKTATTTNNDNGDGDSTDSVLPAQSTTSTAPLTFTNTSDHHPGMSAFQYWYDVETSLYRQYHVGRTGDTPVIPNYMPQSRRGTVRVKLQVKNELLHGGPTGCTTISVFWVNYKGREEPKGAIPKGQVWHQTTWIEHPWVFRLNDDNGTLLLHYIPDRVIPTLPQLPTVDPDDPEIGMHRFAFRNASPEAQRDKLVCSIEDDVLPHPAAHHFLTPTSAITWTLLHMQRMQYWDYHATITTTNNDNNNNNNNNNEPTMTTSHSLLQTYLTNIVLHPEEPKYRRIRIANPKFAADIWQTPARGLLLAVGFVERGPFLELGTAQRPLPRDRVQEVSTLLWRLEQAAAATIRSHGNGSQPEGADGFGRAGYGRAGAMNFG